MKAHRSRWGAAGSTLPADREGNVSWSPGQAMRAKLALLRGEDRQTAADRHGSVNVAVALAELLDL